MTSKVTPNNTVSEHGDSILPLHITGKDIEDGAAAITLRDYAVDQARLAFSKSSYFTPFLVICWALAFAEPVLVGFGNGSTAFSLQIIVLTLSTVGFFIGIYATVVFMKIDSSYWQKIPLAVDGEVGLEAICLILGWTCIFLHPGIAALRCFRVFRYLWYFELITEDLPPNYVPGDHPFSLTNSCHLCLEYLEKLALEVGTADSKGAIVVLGMFFYVTYVFAVVYWNVTTEEAGSATCGGTLSSCYLILMRLAFYDGSGFDFLASLASSSPGMAALLVIYMCITAMVLLNGLIGIFGNAFSPSSDCDSERATSTSSKAREGRIQSVTGAPARDINNDNDVSDEHKTAGDTGEGGDHHDHCANDDANTRILLSKLDAVNVAVQYHTAASAASVTALTDELLTGMRAIQSQVACLAEQMRKLEADMDILKKSNTQAQAQSSLES